MPQGAWIQTGMIKVNVLFGKEMDKPYYEDILEACALNQDIKIWLGRDLNVVGERGDELEWRTKAKDPLTRVVYTDASIYFVDDH